MLISGIEFDLPLINTIYPIHIELLNRYITNLAREHYNRRIPSPQELQHFIDTTPLQRQDPRQNRRANFTEQTTNTIKTELQAKGLELEKADEIAENRLKKQTEIAFIALGIL